MADVTDTYYPATGAIHGYGAQLLVGKGDTVPGPETFQAIALVSVITPGEMTTDVIDRTHLRSPDAHREKMAGLRDSGAFTVEGIYDPKDDSLSNAGGGTGAFTDGGLVFLWRTRAERNFKIVLNDGDPAATPTPIAPTEWPFRGVVTRFQPGAIGIDDKINFTAEVTPLQDFSADLP